MADIGNLTINQQLAGLVVGVPKNITAQHMRNVALSINNKINADAGGDFKADGTVAMTGTMTVQNIIPDGDGTRTFGLDGAAILRIITRNIRADVGQDLIFARDDGLQAFSITTGGVFLLNFGMSVVGAIRFENDKKLHLGINTLEFTFVYETANQTNNTLLFGTPGSEGNTVVFTDTARFTLDHAVGTPSTPTWRWHDGSATVGNWGSITHDGTDFVFKSNAGDIVLDPASNVILPGGLTNTVTLGSSSIAMAKVWTRAVQPDSQGLSLFMVNGTTGISLANNLVQLTANPMRFSDNIQLRFGTSSDTAWLFSTVQDNDHTIFGVDSVTNVFLFTDLDRVGLNFALGVQSTPTMFFHDGSATLTNYGTITHDGTNFLIAANAGTVLLNGIAPILADGSVSLTTTWDAGAFTILQGAIQGRSGGTLQINRGNGGVWASLPNASAVSLFLETIIVDNNILSFGNPSDFQFKYETINQTNNTLLFGTQGSEGNTVVFTDKARITLDHVVGTPGTPTWRWHDGSAVVGNWGSITHDGTDLSIVVNAGDLKVTGNIIPEADGTRTVGNSNAAYATGWFRQIRPDSGVNLTLIAGNSQVAVTIRSSELVFNDGALDRDLRAEGDSDENLWVLDAGLDRVGVGIGGAGQLGKLHVDQASLTGAIPTLYLDQADLSEEFIEFAATIGTGNPIEAIGAKSLTITHFIRVTVAGVGLLYFGVGTIA